MCKFLRKLYHNINGDDYTPVFSPPVKRIKCVLIVGHSESSPGAYNESKNLSEFHFNKKLVDEINNLPDYVTVRKVFRNKYKDLPDDVNKLNPDFIISLHCNAYNKSASGTEVLYYKGNEKGKLYASILQMGLSINLGLADRGIKAKTVEDRGGYLLGNTKAPCIIAEPFFIDNDKDLKIVMDKQALLIKSYVEAIETIATIIIKSRNGEI